MTDYPGTRSYNWAAGETLTANSTAGGFTATTIKPTSGDYAGMVAQIAKVNVESNAIKYTQTGTAPNSTDGSVRYATDVFYIFGPTNIKRFYMIRNGSSNATVKCEYGW